MSGRCKIHYFFVKLMLECNALGQEGDNHVGGGGVYTKCRHYSRQHRNAPHDKCTVLLSEYAAFQQNVQTISKLINSFRISITNSDKTGNIRKK